MTPLLRLKLSKTLVEGNATGGTVGVGEAVAVGVFVGGVGSNSCSYTNTSAVALVSPDTRLVAKDLKAIYCPLGVIDA